jgi:NAD(P)-dependent dehydrogenase (short-subunit alcohol dehydrogenase family)
VESARIKYSALRARAPISASPELNEETVSATVNEIRKLGRRVFFSRTDVSDYDQVQQFIAGAAREFGRIDVLI